MERWMNGNVRLLNDGVRAEDGRVHRANSSLLLTICCYIDSLAAFSVGRTREVFHRNVRPDRDFATFVRTYMDGFMMASRDHSGNELRRSVLLHRCAPGCGALQQRDRLAFPEILYSQYRNGLVHEFLPRGWAGFVRNQNFYLRWDTRRRRLIVNLDRLAPDFRDALRRYCNDVRTSAVIRELYRQRLRFVMKH